MNSVFHYYTSYFLATRAGFDQSEAEILAYSSTYPDHNLVPMTLETNKASYPTISTHHFGFWDPAQEDAVWIPFHFFPAGNPHLGSVELVAPDSAPVKELLVSALKTRNLYRVGIALHTYADTWAHQGFTGRNAKLNVLEHHSPIPAIGHAQAGRNPDQWNLFWVDPRQDSAIIDNRMRFLAAARMIYRYLCTYQRRSFHDEELVLMELEGFLGNPAPGELSLTKSNLERAMAGSASELNALRDKAADTHSTGDQDKGESQGFPDSASSALRDIASIIRKTGTRISKELRLRSGLPKPSLVGKADEDIILDLRAFLGMPEYLRYAWRNAALSSQAGNPIFEGTDGSSDTFLWLKNEVLHRSRLLKDQVYQASQDFESSHFFHWMEAAKAHLEEARRILKQL